MVAGREFSRTDASGSVPVAVVNETLARTLWPTGPGVGRRMHVIDRASQAHEVEVVGVARDSKFSSLSDSRQPVIYLPTSQWYRWDTRILVHTAGNPGLLTNTVRAAVREVNPDIAVSPTTLEQETAFTLVPARLAGTVLAFAGAVGLLLAAVGIFGVVAYTVARERRNIAVRMALGATRWRVVAMFVGRGLRLAAVGLVLGSVAAARATRLLHGLLYGVGPGDPWLVCLCPAGARPDWRPALLRA